MISQKQLDDLYAQIKAGESVDPEMLLNEISDLRYAIKPAFLEGYSCAKSSGVFSDARAEWIGSETAKRLEG